jgi:hypothetical protein
MLGSIQLQAKISRLQERQHTKIINFSEFSLPLRVVILVFKTLVYFSTVYDSKNLKIEEPIHAKCYSIGFEAPWPV